MRSQKTLCRICEAQCGLIVELEDCGNGEERIVNIKPNSDHVVSQGYACIKGLKMADFARSPDRLTEPLKKVNGKFEPISWSRAIDEIGTRLREIYDRDGGAAIAAYTGNPIAFSLWPPMMMAGFFKAFDTDKMFSPGTQDCSNKFAGAERLYGGPNEQMFPDIDHTQLLILIGSNPTISKMSFINMPRPMERLENIEKRGGKLVWVNPRKTESAQKMGQHVAIRPETDAFFLLGFLHELIARGGVNVEHVARHMNGYEVIERLAKPWTAERVESVTRIPCATLGQLVDDFMAADGAAMYCSTGINQTRYGLLSFWLQEVVNAISGNLDRRGGTLAGQPVLQVDLMDNEQKYSRIDNVPYSTGQIPSAIMADEILRPGPGRVRAMFNISGNPLLTCPDSERLAEAFDDLELFVCTDIVRNETAEYADYVLPGLHALERADIPFYFFTMMGLMPKRYLQYTDPVISPPGKARDEGLIIRQICKAAGRPMFGSRLTQLLFSTAELLNKVPALGKMTSLDKLFFGLLSRRAGLGGLKNLRKHPDGLLLEENKPGDYLGQRVKTASGKVELAPADLVARVEALDEVYEEELANSSALKLIQKRERYTHNTWAHNVNAFVKGKRHTNYLYIHPDDARARQLDEGYIAQVSANNRSIELPVKLDPHIMVGTVSVPHGWGHQQAGGLTVANQTQGVNVNIILPSGSDSIEPASGMSHMNGVIVAVEAAGDALTQRETVNS